MVKNNGIVKKVAIALAICLPIVAFFVANVPLKPQFAPISGIFVVLFALPSYYAVYRLLGRKRGLIALCVIGLYALAVETSAIHTGFPYGNFVYNDLLGGKVLGLTPWTVAFAYPPILLASWYVAQRLFPKKHWLIVVLATGIIAMLCDLSLDPAAVRLGFWYWLEPGRYYGVPIVNFLGWILSSSIGALILRYLWGHKAKRTLQLAYSGLIIMWFWTWINIWQAHLVPSVIGILIILLFAKQLFPKTSILRR